MAESKNWLAPKNESRKKNGSQIWLAQKMAGSQKGLASKYDCTNKKAIKTDFWLPENKAGPLR